MEKFFCPESVVVFGVSNRPGNLGTGVIHNLQHFGFSGRYYAVGREEGEVLGVPIHVSLDEIEDRIDLAVILTPTGTMPEVFRQCARRGISRLIIEAGGFREYKDEFRAIEDELLAICREHGMRFIGPNCIGTMNFARRMCLHFSPQKILPRLGGAGLISQSGGITVWFSHLLSQEGVGINKAASVGNKLDVNETDLLEYFLRDPEVEIPILYLEGFSQGRRLFDLARSSDKPILVWKSNAYPQSARIAHSHTAALLADDRVADAALLQAGIYRGRDARHFTVAAKALALKPMKGNRLMIIARSGGHAVMCVDRAARHGFELLTPPASFLEAIARIAPETRIIRQNPLDIGDVFDSSCYDWMVEAALGIPGMDGLAFVQLLTPLEDNRHSEAMMRRVVQLAAAAEVPVAIGYMIQGGDTAALKQSVDYPVFDNPDDTLDALAIARDYWRMKARARRPRHDEAPERDRAGAAALLAQARAPLLPGDLALKLLESYGIATPAWVRGSTVEEAGRLAAEIGFPVALKAIAAELSHKTEAGAVALDLKDAAAVREAGRGMVERIRQNLPPAKIAGFLVQKMGGPGIELIVGGKRDPNFGPVVILGLGGIFVEVLNQVVIRLLPVDREEAREMIAELPGGALLRGGRGQAPADLEALADLILRAGQLLVDHPTIQELDLNPVRASASGAEALDARVIVEPDQTQANARRQP